MVISYDLSLKSGREGQKVEAHFLVGVDIQF